MAEPRIDLFGGEPLFATPEHLVLEEKDLAATFEPNTDLEHQKQHYSHETTWVSENQHPFRQHTLPLHSISKWTTAAQNDLQSLLPTQSSPFGSMRPLTKEERLAFPCLGDFNSCWNIELCPKHRQDSSSSSTPSSVPPQLAPDHYQGTSTPFISNSDSTDSGTLPKPPNPRRRTVPTESDIETLSPPAKAKRYATDPEEADSEISGHKHHRRDSRSNSLRGRVPHNLVERRYRDNLNNQIEALRLTIPSLKDAQPDDDKSLAWLNPLLPRIPSKAVVISTATSYIKDMETERSRLLAANKVLQEQVLGLQKLLCEGQKNACSSSSVLQYLSPMGIVAVQR